MGNLRAGTLVTIRMEGMRYCIKQIHHALPFTAMINIEAVGDGCLAGS